MNGLFVFPCEPCHALGNARDGIHKHEAERTKLATRKIPMLISVPLLVLLLLLLLLLVEAG